MWHDGDQPLKEQSALSPDAGSLGLIHHGCPSAPRSTPSVPLSMASWPPGGPVINGECDFLQVSEFPVKSLPHPTWRGILDVWSTWFQPAPLLPKWYNSPQSIFSRGAKNALYKRHLSSSSSPLGPFTELKQGGWQAFSGSCPIHAFSDILIWL